MTQVKIDEVLRLVCDIAAEIPAHDTVPGRVIFLVKFLQKERERKVVQTQKGSHRSSSSTHIQLFPPTSSVSKPTLHPSPGPQRLRF